MTNTGTDLLAAFFDDAAAQNGEGERAALVHDLAEDDGTALVDDLVARGHSVATIAACLAQPEGDKRSKPLLRAVPIGDLRVVTLSSSGWTAAGQPNRREKKPNARNIAHALAPQRMRAWAARVDAWLASQGAPVRLRVRDDSAAVQKWAQTLSGSAWSEIRRSGGDPSGITGALTEPRSAPRPDALLYEEWSNPTQMHNWWPGFVRDGDEMQSLVLAVEVETTAKETDDLRAKVARLNACISLGALDGVLWVVNDVGIVQRVQRWVNTTTRGDADVQKRHIYAAADAVGMGGPVVMGVPQPTWWLPAQARAAGIG